jgi:hypothetical protein
MLKIGLTKLKIMRMLMICELLNKLRMLSGEPNKKKTE